MITREQMIDALADIRDQLVRDSVQAAAPALGDSSATREADRMAGAVQALCLMLGDIDSWVDGAKDNHEALEHRGESQGSECWRSFAPSDIRNMVNDVAREMGISEFPLPEKAREDEPR